MDTPAWLQSIAASSPPASADEEVVPGEDRTLRQGVDGVEDEALPAGDEVYHVDEPVVCGERHQVALERRRRNDTSVGGEGPELLSCLSVDGVERAVPRPGVDHTTVDGR